MCSGVVEMVDVAGAVVVVVVSETVVVVSVVVFSSLPPQEVRTKIMTTQNRVHENPKRFIV